MPKPHFFKDKNKDSFLTQFISENTMFYLFTLFTFFYLFCFWHSRACIVLKAVVHTWIIGFCEGL
jgi:hypothetical protein